jgi:hypothetical protein
MITQIIFEIAKKLRENTIDLEYNYKMPIYGEGIYGGRDGYYLSKSNYEPFNYDLVKSLFPMTIFQYKVELEMITDAEFEEDKASKPAIHVIISKIKQLPATIWLANELIKQGLLNIGVEETEKFHTIFNLANEKHMKQVCRAFNDADDEEDFAYEYYLNTFEL